MKWYKHVSTSLDDPFIYELLLEFGSDGYLVFFGTLEIYSREFSPEKEWKLDIKMKYFHKKFLISPKKIKKILEKISKWEVSFDDDRVRIFIPKFKELLDNYTRNEKINTDKLLASDSQETFQPIKNKEERVKNKEKDNTPKGVFVLPDWIPEETWRAYLAVRNKKKAPNTDYALKLIIKELEKYKPNHLPIINQSIKNGWVDMYPLKEANNASKGFSTNQSRGFNNNQRAVKPEHEAELDRIAAAAQAAVCNSQKDA